MFVDDDGNALDGSEALVVGNENAQEIGCEPFIRRSNQPGPSTLCIQDTFGILHLNHQGI